MEGQKNGPWPLLVILIIIVIVIAGAYYLYPREQKVVSETIGVLDPLFKTPDQNNEQNMSTTTQAAVAIMHTNQGDITIELYPEKAPNAVENFLKLSKAGFYNGSMFHRVIAGFMIQGGDPNTKAEPKNWRIHGTGGPGYKFADEQNDLGLGRGILAMANSGPNTNGSQFFIMTAKTPMQLAGYYTSFGKVVGDMSAVDKIEATPVDRAQNDHPLADMVINSIEIK